MESRFGSCNSVYDRNENGVEFRLGVEVPNVQWSLDSGVLIRYTIVMRMEWSFDSNIKVILLDDDEYHLTH